MSDNDSETPEALNVDVPGHLGYSAEHVWVDASTEPAVLGITAYAAEQLGDLVFVDLPEPGTRIEVGDEVLELESSKVVEPLVSPVSGTIRYVNHDLDTDPGVVNHDPYGEGWILKVELDDEEPDLLDAAQYAKVVD